MSEFEDALAKHRNLVGITIEMEMLQAASERLARYVKELDRLGVKLPMMAKTARMLTEIAQGWEMGA